MPAQFSAARKRPGRILSSFSPLISATVIPTISLCFLRFPERGRALGIPKWLSSKMKSLCGASISSLTFPTWTEPLHISSCCAQFRMQFPIKPVGVKNRQHWVCPLFYVNGFSSLTGRKPLQSLTL